jgi:hypothetical protein
MSASRRRRLGHVHPCGIATALDGIAREHRHLPRAISGLAAWEAVSAIGWPVGWLLMGRPVSRELAGRGWVEVTRCATTGRCWGAASALYRAAEEWAAAQDRPILTYTLGSEPGASLVAAGWQHVGWTRGGQFRCSARPRAVVRNGEIAEPKRRWASPRSLPHVPPHWLRDAR